MMNGKIFIIKKKSRGHEGDRKNKNLRKFNFLPGKKQAMLSNMRAASIASCVVQIWMLFFFFLSNSIVPSAPFVGCDKEMSTEKVCGDPSFGGLLFLTPKYFFKPTAALLAAVQSSLTPPPPPALLAAPFIFFLVLLCSAFEDAVAVVVLPAVPSSLLLGVFFVPIRSTPPDDDDVEPLLFFERGWGSKSSSSSKVEEIFLVAAPVSKYGEHNNLCCSNLPFLSFFSCLLEMLSSAPR
jgi:hypothetical protein